MKRAIKPTDVGTNRTGLATSPIDGKAVIEGARRDTSSGLTDAGAFEVVRLDYASGAPPVGTMPPPASAGSAAKAIADKVTGRNTMVLLDQLGERLAFERTGARLYDALLVKRAERDAHPGGPSREDLERIRDEEIEHFALLKEAIEALGGDPTAVTPSADVGAVAGSGWVAALSDPRTTLTQGLKVVLQAELTDTDSWLVLADLTARLGHGEIADQFRRALAEEEDHLARVRSWLLAAVEGQVGLKPSADDASAGAPVP
jgi:rubrerythrin